MINFNHVPFFPHRLSPAKRNYNIANRVLLPVKLVLEEWHHWLEGAAQPFMFGLIIRTSLFIQSPKVQTGKMFFDRFNFSLTHHPGSHNVTAVSADPEPILPLSCFIASIIREMESLTKQAYLTIRPY